MFHYLKILRNLFVQSLDRCACGKSVDRSTHAVINEFVDGGYRNVHSGV